MYVKGANVHISTVFGFVYNVACRVVSWIGSGYAITEVQKCVSYQVSTEFKI